MSREESFEVGVDYVDLQKTCSPVLLKFDLAVQPEKKTSLPPRDSEVNGQEPEDSDAEMETVLQTSHENVDKPTETTTLPI